MPSPIVPSDVRTLADGLAEPRPMQRGSVSERYVKCNKAGCSCGDDDNARHGPYYSLSRVVRGRTQSRWLDDEQARLVREQVEAGHQFRKRVEAYWQACERWANAQVDAPEAAPKGGSKRPSRRRLSRRSKRS